MEDAMILNKSSYERGFAHASVYKTKIVDLAEERKRSAKPGSGTGGGALKFGNYAPRSRFNSRNRFTRPPPGGSGEGSGGPPGSEEVKVYEALDDDGLPHVGDFVKEGDPLVRRRDTSETGRGKGNAKNESNKIVLCVVACVRARNSDATAASRYPNRYPTPLPNATRCAWWTNSLATLLPP